MGGPGGALINRPPGTSVDHTLHLLPPIAVTVEPPHHSRHGSTSSSALACSIRYHQLAGRALALPFTPCATAHVCQNHSNI
jgi:hypothetical protein